LAKSITAIRAGTLLLLVFLPCLTCSSASAENAASSSPPRLVYASGNRQPYALTLLTRALHVAGHPHELVEHTAPYEQGQSLKVLANDRGIDISWSMTSIAREEMLLPIRIPIFKGLIGWRLPLVNVENSSRFSSVQSLQELQQYTAGQVHDWPDVEILEWNGVEVFKSGTYDGLFKMLAMGRIDYFPRSVIEIWGELDQKPDLGLLVDPYVALHYPTAFYYFVSRSRPDLKALISKGLKILQETGEFDQLFLHYHKDVIERAQLHRRQVISMVNPGLPEKTPLGDESLWYKVQGKGRAN